MNSYRPKSEDIFWGDQLCMMPRCVQLAEVMYEDLPYCIDCADLLIERQVAISLDPSMRYKLPNLWDR